MGIKLQDIMTVLDDWAPPRLATSWDKIGLQMGHPESEIKKILVAVDVDDDVLKTIESKKIDLVITHHPLFFRPFYSVDPKSDMGRILKTFLNTQSSLFVMHTNLDATDYGVNDALIKAYGLDVQKAKALKDGYPKIIETKTTLASLSKKHSCRVLGDASPSKSVKKLAFCGGSGGSFLPELYKQGVDTYITGEINYHDSLFAKMNGISVLVMGHKESEKHVLPHIKERLEKQFSILNIQIL